MIKRVEKVKTPYVFYGVKDGAEDDASLREEDLPKGVLFDRMHETEIRHDPNTGEAWFFVFLRVGFTDEAVNNQVTFKAYGWKAKLVPGKVPEFQLGLAPSREVE